jgi:hypothetical protein
MLPVEIVSLFLLLYDQCACHYASGLGMSDYMDFKVSEIGERKPNKDGVSLPLYPGVLVP